MVRVRAPVSGCFPPISQRHRAKFLFIEQDLADFFGFTAAAWPRRTIFAK
jgi:hypothetical protein